MRKAIRVRLAMPFGLIGLMLAFIGGLFCLLADRIAGNRDATYALAQMGQDFNDHD